jgi:hypothetical protein
MAVEVNLREQDTVCRAEGESFSAFAQVQSPSVDGGLRP